MSYVAIIPVKHSSERVHAKNFREFSDGKSILDIKIQQLKNSNEFEQIFVSSDSPDAVKACEYYDVKFLLRDAKFCDNVAPWSDVIHEVVKSLPVPDETNIAWCHTVTPIFSRFSEAINLYEEAIKNDSYNGLVAVTQCKEFILDELATPVNYSWGPWHKYSQHLKKYYFVSGALFLSTKSEMIRNRYVISTKPKMFITTPQESVDIDTEFDFEFAQYIYSKLITKPT